MRHSFQPSPPREARAQTPTSASSQSATLASKAAAAEDVPSSPSLAAGLRNQRTFSLASFGSLDLRGAPSQALSVASSQVDEADPPPSSVISTHLTPLQNFDFCARQLTTTSLLPWIVPPSTGQPSTGSCLSKERTPQAFKTFVSHERQLMSKDCACSTAWETSIGLQQLVVLAWFCLLCSRFSSSIKSYACNRHSQN